MVLLLLVAGASSALARDEAAPPADVRSSGAALAVDISGAIGPATVRHLDQAFAAARDRGARLVILRMDTPGGLAESMRDIIRTILASPVPVVGYVAPSGARAASAGTYILYATHIAAMAPGTNLGAATPIQIGGAPTPLPHKNPEGPDGTAEEPPDDAPKDAASAKAVNDAVAYIRSLAELRGRNAEWAEKAVREAASLSAGAALKRDVVDLMATDIPDLLAKIDGRTVQIGDRKVTLATAGLAVERIEPDWRTELLSVLTNPNIAFILLLVGVYGLIFEFITPGTFGPGVIGAVCLLLGLYALNLLPFSYMGIGLLLLGMSFMVAEAFLPSFGVLGIGGVAAFILGAALLFDAESPAFRISWSVIAGAGLASGALLVFLVGYAWRAHRRPVATGVAQMVGSSARVVDWAGSGGHVHVHGERWRATGAGPFEIGQTVEISEVRDLTLIVKPPEPDKKGP